MSDQSAAAPPPVAEPQPSPADDAPKEGAAERLRAFEDQHLGEDAPRIAGKVERGHGSPFAMLKPPELRDVHCALEALLKAESDLTAARNALLKADDAHAAAEQRVADAEAAVPADEPAKAS